MLKSSNKEITIHSILVWVVLLSIIVGGGILIMHDPSWTLDDATIIQSSVGSGRMMHVWDEPGFQPKAGRFFPLAYMHTNLVLLFTDGYISAKPLFILNLVMWIGFALLLFYLCYNVLRGNLQTKALAEWISLLVVLVVFHRTFYNFAVLWTTFPIDNLLSVMFCICFFQYLNSEGKKKRLYGMGALLTLAYFSFCIEVNLVLPFVVGLSLLLSSKKKDFLTISSLLVVLFYFIFYFILIMPYTESYYDSSHGDDGTMLSNAIKMVLWQKLLIVMFVVLVYRFYRIVLKKDAFDPFSDSLLLSSAGYTLGCFALRLNWGLYYTIPIVFALPAMLKLLDFGSVRNGVVSSLVVLVVFSFYIIKYPRLCKGVCNEKTKASIDMAHFNAVLKHEDAIVWYEDEMNHKYKWKKCHVARSLKHLKEDEGFELLSHEHVTKGVALLTPDVTNTSELKDKYFNLNFVEKDRFAGFVLYQVN